MRDVTVPNTHPKMGREATDRHRWQYAACLESCTLHRCFARRLAHRISRRREQSIASSTIIGLPAVWSQLVPFRYKCRSDLCRCQLHKSTNPRYLTRDKRSAFGEFDVGHPRNRARTYQWFPPGSNSPSSRHAATRPPRSQSEAVDR